MHNLEIFSHLDLPLILISIIRESTTSLKHLSKLMEEKKFLKNCTESLIILLSYSYQTICNLLNPYNSWYTFHQLNEEQKNQIENELLICTDFQKICLKSGFMGTIRGLFNFFTSFDFFDEKHQIL